MPIIIVDILSQQGCKHAGTEKKNLTVWVSNTKKIANAG